MERMKKRAIGSNKEVRIARFSPHYSKPKLKSSSYEDPSLSECIPHRKEKINSTSDIKGDFRTITNMANSQNKTTASEKPCNNPTEKEEIYSRSLENSLDNMAKRILDKVTLIQYDSQLYYYTGRTYQSISNGEELLKLIRSKVSHDAFGTRSVKRFSDLLIFLRSDEHLIPHDLANKLWDSQYFIVFRNGVLDLREKKLLQHSPKYLTFYELNAEWENSSYSPEFQSFLDKISRGDPEIQQRVLEVMGYLLSSVNEGKYFFVMGTAPNSGKSTLGELIKRLLGNEFVISRSPNQLARPFSLGDIQNKLLNLSLDLPHGKLPTITVSIIKQITGGDMISIEPKYEKIRDVRTNLRFLFGSNFPVTIPVEDNDDAFWNRMIIVPFLYSLEKEREDPNILPKLLREKNAIIYKCLKAFRKVLKNHFIFSYCEVAEKMKYAWRFQKYDSSDSIKSFIEQCITVTGNPCDRVYSVDLYENYRRFCLEQNLNHLSYIDFMSWICSNISECQQKRMRLTKGNPRSGLIGIRYKDNDPLNGEGDI